MIDAVDPLVIPGIGSGISIYKSFINYTINKLIGSFQHTKSMNLYSGYLFSYRKYANIANLFDNISASIQPTDQISIDFVYPFEFNMISGARYHLKYA